MVQNIDLRSITMRLLSSKTRFPNSGLISAVQLTYSVWHAQINQPLIGDQVHLICSYLHDFDLKTRDDLA